MYLKYLWLLFIGLPLISSAQNFRSQSNPYYWKNKKPFSDYWQQDVHYRIKAGLDEKNEIITGRAIITYYNNSPDTLKELFFNLYQNAFLEGSHLSNLSEANGTYPKYGKWEKARKGNEIISIQTNGKEHTKEIDNSIMKTPLESPLKPGDSIDVLIVFKTYYSGGGETRRRMKSFSVQGKKHFNGAHWYPRLAVYDRKFGWCTDQHLNREFYGDFGTYEVELNMPADFVVDATGVLMNAADAMPPQLRKQLDLSNFWNNKWEAPITYKIPCKKNERKTWMFKADHVHDFAWIAGPSYRIHDSTINGIKVVAMVQENHASGWKNAVHYTHQVMKVYGDDFGPYGYPKMIVADCQDGMEYPMLTMDGGSDPDYRGLLAHEVGHNWFYGMINNNETYRAMLDEGFTQFLTAWAMEHIDGKYKPISPITNKYVKKYYDSVATREEKIYWSYHSDAMHENDATLNTHSDGFHGALGQGGGYRHVYSKTATMLYNLQYVLGDTLFQNAMKHYFKQWSYCHPYIEDFRNSIIHYTKVDLNWFFDQWIETTKNIDYSIKKIEKLEDDNKYRLTIERKGNMQMPLDIVVTTRAKKQYHYHIPNTWFQKQFNGNILPRWIGWDEKLNKTYTAELTIDGDIQSIQIDPSGRLADINLLDNSLQCPVKVYFDSKISNFPDRFNYHLRLRPDIWYNNFDGVKIGMHLEGNYLKTKHLFNLDIWGNTTVSEGAMRRGDTALHQHNYIDFRFTYKNDISKIIKNGTVGLEVKFLEGLAYAQAEFVKKFNDKVSAGINYTIFTRLREADFNYLYYQNEWERNYKNGAFNFFMNVNNAKKRWSENLNIHLRASAFGSRSAYSFLSTQYLFNLQLKKIVWKYRFYARIGSGANTPKESMLYAAGANPEEMMTNKYMRSVTFFPEELYKGYDGALDHLQFGGGLNLRGYSGRSLIVFNTRENNYQPLYKGNSGLAFNTELEFNQLFKIRAPKLGQYVQMNTYFFGDMGSIGNIEIKTNSNAFFSNLLADAGLGASLTIKKFWVLQQIKPLTIRFDMPFFVNTPGIDDGNNYWKFRWVLGINRAF